MKSSLPSPTKAQSRRFEIIKREVGCIVHGNWADAHHQHSGGVRISHDHTIPLCKNCHWLIHNRKRQFHLDHGTDAELLEKTNKRVSEIEGNIIGGALK
jgi:hypothetical protein